MIKQLPKGLYLLVYESDFETPRESDRPCKHADRGTFRQALHIADFTVTYPALQLARHPSTLPLQLLHRTRLWYLLQRIGLYTAHRAGAHSSTGLEGLGEASRASVLTGLEPTHGFRAATCAC